MALRARLRWPYAVLMSGLTDVGRFSPRFVPQFVVRRPAIECGARLERKASDDSMSKDEERMMHVSGTDGEANAGVVEVCGSCGGSDLELVVSLGRTPVANALVDPSNAAGTDPTYPLDVVFCSSCALVQLGFALSAEQIFDSEYPYFSSYSDELCRHAAEHVNNLIATRALGPESFAVEVASNDGYLLRNFVAAGVRALGIDPSPGPAAAAVANGIPTIVGFFGVDSAQRILDEHGPADVIIANNVMAHVPDLNDFVSGLAVLLADDGVLTIENPSVRDLVEHVEFDTIYHEHYSYFSCTSVDSLMRRHDLFLNDVEYFPHLHGGTLRWYVEKASNRSARCAEYLDDERLAGMATFDYYRQFGERVATCQLELRDLLNSLLEKGRTIAAYGAAAKGATLLNSTKLDVTQISFVVDRNVHKQGKLMPGCRLPILPVEALLEQQPDDVLLLAWNFAAEIVAQQQEFVKRGGTFYVPVPSPRPVAAS
jgi:SAM-dependent methyltransferase